MNIVPASLDDLPQLSEVLVGSFYANTMFADIVPPDYKSYISVSSKIIMDGMFIVAKEDGKIVGAIAGLMSPFIFNHNFNVAVEMLWFVMPEYRKTGIGDQLLNALETKAKENNCVMLTMCHFHNEQSKKLGKTFEDKGFALSEFSYVKKLT